MSNIDATTIDPVVVAKALIDGYYCSSIDEANLLTDIILSDLLLEGEDDDNNNNVVVEENQLASCLSEHLDISISQANELSKKIIIRNNDGEDSSDDDDEQTDNDDSNSDIGIIDFDNDENDDGSDELLLGEGECELCDRYIKLTRHHLIPRSTWPKISKLLERSLALHQKGETSKALERLGSGLQDRFDELLLVLMDDSSSSSSSSTDNQKIKLILQTTCDICRQCHNCVHNTHTNLELALTYNTVDKLLSDQQISKFCKWANKQRPAHIMIGNTVRR